MTIKYRDLQAGNAWNTRLKDQPEGERPRERLNHVVLGGAIEERPKDYASLRELGYFYS